MTEDDLINESLGYLAQSLLDDRVWVPIIPGADLSDMLHAAGLRRAKAWMQSQCGCEITWVRDGDDRWYAMPVS